MDIGRKFTKSSLALDLNIGITFAVFIKSGTLPHSMDLLTMIEIGLATLWNISFNKIELRL